jgi:hypothetical protein
MREILTPSIDSVRAFEPDSAASPLKPVLAASKPEAR